MSNKKVISILARLSEAEAEDLLDLQKMTERNQADAIRYAIRTTARALRIAEALQTQAILQSPALPGETTNPKEE